MGKHVSREMPIHVGILGYLRDKFPNAIIHHSPNEFGMSGKAVARQIAKHKRMGMVVGFPDLVVIHCGAVMGFEVKAEGNYARPSQKAVGEQFKANGAFWAVVRSKDDVRDCLAEWGVFVGNGDNFETVGVHTGPIPKKGPAQ